MDTFVCALLQLAEVRCFRLLVWIARGCWVSGTLLNEVEDFLGERTVRYRPCWMYALDIEMEMREWAEIAYRLIVRLPLLLWRINFLVK